MDLLTTYTHDWELQAITMPPLNPHTLQTTTELAKPFSSLLCLQQPFPGNDF
jgi:hypothetical protein